MISFKYVGEVLALLGIAYGLIKWVGGNLRSVITDAAQEENRLEAMKLRRSDPNEAKRNWTEDLEPQLSDPKAPREIRVYDVVDGKLRNSKQFLATAWDNYTGFADGIRADTDGNVWIAIGQGANGTGSAKADGDAVYAVSPQGVKIGKILLPEICANVCFGGTRRNRLFMAASQSIYSLYVDVKGAHIA